ncbi:MAG: C39 family peptidase [Polyangiaceae bacterium]
MTGSAHGRDQRQMAARKTDCVHPGPGTIVVGSPNVEIGGAVGGATLGDPQSAGDRCRAMAAGRTSGSTQQSYNNCGIESSRQLINQAGGNMSEDQLFDWALNNGQASRETTGKWYNRQTDRVASGGTHPGGRNTILNSNGVAAHTETGSMANLTQAVAEGRGVISSHDANVLWYNNAQPQVAGHAIVPTGLEYGPDGTLQNVIINDTGTGRCQQSKPAAQFESSLRPGRDLNVTDNPIW